MSKQVAPVSASRRTGVRRVPRLCADDVEAIASDAQRVAGFARVFANPVRGQILMLVAHFGSFTVTDLAILVRRSVPLTSSYIAQLKEAGWLTVQAVGREKSVRVASHPQRCFIELMRNLSATDLPDKPVDDSSRSPGS